MTEVTPERELANKHLKAAEQLAAAFKLPRDKALAEYVVALGEALMRAQREVDDDLWWVKEALTKHGIDLAAVGGDPDAFAEMELGAPASTDDNVVMSERNLVDEALRRASRVITEASARGIRSTEVRWLELSFQIVSSYVRQTRDLDDDLSHLRRSIEEHGGRLAVAFSESLSASNR